VKVITLILAIALVGFLVYAIITYIPMPPLFKNAIIVIVVILLILYLMRALGVADIPLR